MVVVMEKEEMEMERRAYARVGLLGNPSDVYGGRARVFHDHCKHSGIALEDKNFALSYDTNIPRQAGLSGSSAIVCAALSCLLDFYGVRDRIGVEVRPSLILNAEKELGIVAGLQDRVAQVYGGLVYMDFSQEHMDKLGHGVYTPLEVDLLPPLYLIYAENPSDSGKVHSSVRQRWLDGDEFIISSMKEVAQLAYDGHNVLLQKNYTELARLMNKNFDLRRKMFGDDALGEVNIKMVEVARSVGAASKFTGSGGAVVALCPDGDAQAELLKTACQEAGFMVEQIEVAPSALTKEELASLSDYLNPGHDQYVYRHPNGLCVVGLAPAHVALKEEGGITAIDFNVGKTDRSEIKVTGKRKRVIGVDNAQHLQENSALCKVCTKDKTFVVRCCVKGQLLEINDRLMKQPDLLNTSADREGYIAIFMQKPADWLKVKDKFLSFEEYKNLRGIC
ncbi:putative glucuronokinase 2 [Triticum urartu]|uniref:Putative glucuronokinase 2 n=1 Tax=Triticum urartu TaxID=4572 RepID=M8A610_TRIUA|nr:putative glucuronokinase 2 [Triticum urartu]